MTQTLSDLLVEQFGDVELTVSERHQILSVERRRILLNVLSDRPSPVELTTVAADVARQESASETASEETIKQIAVSLHHIHLPLLNQFQILDYDSASKRITSVNAEILL